MQRARHERERIGYSRSVYRRRVGSRQDGIGTSVTTDERLATAIEYVILSALLAIAVLAVLRWANHRLEVARVMLQAIEAVKATK